MSLNSSPTQVFLYNYIKNPNNVKFSSKLDDDNDDDDDSAAAAFSAGGRQHEITTRYNFFAQLNGYCVDKGKFENLCLKFKEILKNCNLKNIKDLGITIVLLNFAKYYVCNQYALFVNDFNFIEELDDLKKFLYACNDKFVNFDKNLMISKKYGIKSLYKIENYTRKFVKYSEFLLIVNLMTGDDYKNDNYNMIFNRKFLFLNLIKHYHLNVIESFYAFTSFTRNCKVLKECEELNRPILNYKMEKFIDSHDMENANYWFVLPSNSIWFFYTPDEYKIFGFIDKSYVESLKHVEKILTKKISNNNNNNNNILIFGFLNNCNVYVLDIRNCFYFDAIVVNDDDDDDKQHQQKWTILIKLLNELNLNCIYRKYYKYSLDYEKYKKKKNVYFVKNNSRKFFKFV